MPKTEERLSASPVVAIVGSLRPQILPKDEERQQAEQAAVELGRELALAGCRLLVYSSHEDFVEPFVVRGYVASGQAQEGSIVCRFPKEIHVSFPEQATHGKVFDRQPDSTEDWEISFYRSLYECQGILLIGGGSSTLIAGQVALSYGLPVVAIGAFGGRAERVWKLLDQNPHLADPKEVKAMASAGPGQASRWVQSLVRQYEEYRKKKEREAEEIADLRAKATQLALRDEDDRKTRQRQLVAGFSLLCFLVSLGYGWSSTASGTLFSAFFLVALAAAGGSGATVRLLRPSPPVQSVVTTLILGVAAGVVVSLLYLLPQMLGLDPGSTLTPQAKDLVAKQEKLFFISASLVAFAAGVAFDYTLDKVRQVGESRADEAAMGKPAEKG